MEIPLSESRAKLRELRDQPYKLSATGLAMLDETQPQQQQQQAVVEDEALEGSSKNKTLSSTTQSGDEKKKKRTPGMRLCHLCGTPQLLGSFKLHLKRCARAWEQDEASKPASLRRPLPAGPRLPEPTAATSEEALEEFNREALRVWKSRSLETCPNCRRSFHSKALRAHVKGCHGDDFLGASFLGPHKNRTGREPKRSYPTVQQALDRKLSSRGGGLGCRRAKESTKSDGANTTAEESTKPSTTVASSPSSSSAAARSKGSKNDAVSTSRAVSASSAASSTLEEDDDLRSSAARKKKTTPARERRRPNTAANRRSTAANFRSPKTSTKKKKPTFEERLSSLEANHHELSASLRRIEALLSTSRIVTPPASPQQQPGDGPVLAREYRRVFRGNVDLAWPDQPAAQDDDLRLASPPPRKQHQQHGRSERQSEPRRRGFVWRPEPLS